MSDAACHLYFDLEFDRQLNPDRDGERMVDILLQVIHTSLTPSPHCCECSADFQLFVTFTLMFTDICHTL